MCTQGERQREKDREPQADSTLSVEPQESYLLIYDFNLLL